MSQKIDSALFELIIAYNCLTGNAEYLATIAEYISPELFHDSDIQAVMSVISDYYEQYDKPPSVVEIKARLATAQLRSSFVAVVNRLPEVKGDYDPAELAKNTETFLKERKLMQVMSGVMTSHEKQRPIDYDKVFEQLDEAHSITLLDDLGMDYFGDIEQHCDKLKETDKFISTGWKWLDEKLGGGWLEHGRALYVFSGVTNVGKSIFLGNIACNALLQNKVVVLISLEMSEHVYAKRIDSQLSKIAMSNLANSTDQLKAFVNQFKADRCKSKLLIKEFPPSTVNARHISAYIKKLTRRKIKPDIIIVDYLSLLEPTKVTGSSYVDVKKTAEQIRALSYIFECPTISASQLNRDAFGQDNPGLETTSESMGLPHTVDAQFNIWCSEDDVQLNQINLGIMKNRFGPKHGSTLLFLDYNTLSLYEDSVPVLNNGMNNLIESVKGNSAVATTQMQL